MISHSSRVVLPGCSGLTPMPRKMSGRAMSMMDELMVAISTPSAVLEGAIPLWRGRGVVRGGAMAGRAPGVRWRCQIGTSFGEASSRTQATDPNRRETLRIRTPLPGLRGEAKWLRKALPVSRTRCPTDTERYAVECQSSYERGDPRLRFQ